MNKYKYKTHNELCSSKELHKCSKLSYIPLIVHSRVPVVDTEGRVIYTSKKTIVDNREKFKSLRVTDFGMSNLIEIGADKKLNSVSMSPDRFVTIQNIERSISIMESKSSESSTSVNE